MEFTSCRRCGSLDSLPFYLVLPPSTHLFAVGFEGDSLPRHIFIAFSSCSGYDTVQLTRPRNLVINFRAVQVGEMGKVSSELFKFISLSSLPASCFRVCHQGTIQHPPGPLQPRQSTALLHLAHPLDV
jgi:hypothetical protein